MASARIILQTLNKNGIEGVKNLIISWFGTIRSVMFLTGSHTIADLRKNKIILKERLF